MLLSWQFGLAQKTHKTQTSGLEYSLHKKKVLESRTEDLLVFEDAIYKPEQDLMPRIFSRKVLGYGDFEASVSLEVDGERPLTKEERKGIKESVLTGNYQLSHRITTSRKKRSLEIEVLPFRKSSTGEVFALTSYRFIITQKSKPLKRNATNNFTSSSVLSSGNWYKFGVTEEGIYKIDRDFLLGLGIDFEAVNLNNIRIFGNGGKMLPISNSEPRIDDLAEVAVYTEGLDDGVLQSDDKIWFYGQSPHRWRYTGSRFVYDWNNYSDTTYYFLTFDYAGGLPKRINEQSFSGSQSQEVVAFDDHKAYERDLYNLIKSGRTWYGEFINVNTTARFPFEFPNVITSEQATLRGRFAVRSIGSKSTIQMGVENTASIVDSTPSSVAGDYDLPFANPAELEVDFFPPKSAFTVKVVLFKSVQTATAWVDYLELNVRRKLVYPNDAMFFRDARSVGGGLASFTVEAADENVWVWNVTDHQSVYGVSYNASAGEIEFLHPTDTLHQFVVFKEKDVLTPQRSVGRIENQDLHSLETADLTIVTHPKFLSHAEDLAEFHRLKDTLTVNVATTNQIYNEFSSGKQDITGIKDFMRMFYERAGGDTTLFPKYLLLFGDASYDYKNIVQGNSNYVPTFQSGNSLVPTASYVSDDYFGLLDPDEGQSSGDRIDLGIGRFPVQTPLEARNAVAKTKSYYRTSTFGSWRNNVTFIADDEDDINSLIHMRDADTLAKFVDRNYVDYNLDKIYFDAYNQEATPGGNRYPEVKEAINRRVDRGGLILNYIGHGGELGWAHERVLEIPDVNSWDNKNNLPLFVTATCQFTRFDAPERTSAGEYVFLNPDGGGIGLLTTTRLVFSTPNFELSREFNRIAFEKLNGRFQRLGDLVRVTKYEAPPSNNSRCFSLIGDPAIKLAYPKLQVFSTSVPDTMKALQKITITGFVADNNGTKLTNYNGIVYPTVFAQEKTIGTLNNDGRGVFRFKLQNEVIFKGKASVKNGKFSFSFVVPKDVDMAYGKGKISYYAENGEIDANGAYESHQIGGVAEDFAEDNKGPDIELYLNDDSFVFGGLTDQSPMIFAKLFDENGVNTVGNGIGHDIVAVIDENTANPIVLNDYYESDLDSYQSGVIKYGLSELEEGKHTLRLKAWDVYNNSGEAYLEFYVAKNDELMIDHVLNYPNPFTTNTNFYFDHNQPGQSLQVRLQVFTVSGKLVKTIDGFYGANGYRLGPINWNGRDDFGDPIGRGVYIYKLSVSTPSGKTAEKYEKLVILN